MRVSPPIRRGTDRRLPPREYSYARMMQVSIQHTYYDASGRRCPDFSIHPTPTTRTLMNALGLLFREEETGFSILYNEKTVKELVQYLRRLNSGDERQEPISTRILSFALAVKNADFVNLTAIPIGMNPLNRNFYLSNRWAHRQGQRVFLNQGEFVHPIRRSDDDPTANYLKVVRPHDVVSASKKVKEVQLVDISGTVVRCTPRCLPRSLTQRMDPSSVSCEDVAEFVK